MEPLFPAAALEEAAHWAAFFGSEWAQGFPEAAPARWPDDIAALLVDAPDATAGDRTARVMRKLRRVSPRSYEVLLRTMIHGEGLEATTAWLNERAVRNAIPVPAGQDVNYTLKDTVALFLAGVDFARSYF